MAFKLKHYLKSSSFPNIKNTPGVDQPLYPELTKEYIIDNLVKLHTNCIQPIVEVFGENDIGLLAGYRSIELNRALGGVENSHHTRGLAADIISFSRPTADIWNWCIQYLRFNHLIWEYPERGVYTSSNNKNFSWISISYIEGSNQNISSLSSERDDLHEMYESDKSCRIVGGNFTHNIDYADNNLI